MVQERSGTPEKQLLNLIENPGRQGINQEEAKRRSSGLFSIGALRGRFSFFKGRIGPKIKIRRLAFSIKKLNLLLKLAIVFLVFYLGTDVVRAMLNLNKIPDITVNIPAVKSGTGTSGALQVKDLSNYLGKPKARDIFRFGEVPVVVKKEEKPKKEVEKPVETPKINEMIKSLSLVGISWSDDPDAMVEDTEVKQVYFLKAGQYIKGSLKIEKILSDRIVVSYEGEQTELEIK